MRVLASQVDAQLLLARFLNNRGASGGATDVGAHLQLPPIPDALMDEGRSCCTAVVRGFVNGDASGKLQVKKEMLVPAAPMPPQPAELKPCDRCSEVTTPPWHAACYDVENWAPWIENPHQRETCAKYKRVCFSCYAQLNSEALFRDV